MLPHYECLTEFRNSMVNYSVMNHKSYDGESRNSAILKLATNKFSNLETSNEHYTPILKTQNRKQNCFKYFIHFKVNTLIYARNYNLKYLQLRHFDKGHCCTRLGHRVWDFFFISQNILSFNLTYLKKKKKKKKNSYMYYLDACFGYLTKVGFI